MSLEHLGHPDNRPKTARHIACIPLVEELLGARGVDVLPEPAELLFDRSRPGYLQSVLPDCLEASPLLQRQFDLLKSLSCRVPLRRSSSSGWRALFSARQT